MLSTQPICLSLNANYQSFQLRFSGLSKLSTKKQSSKHNLSRRQQHNWKNMLVSRQQCRLSSQSERINTPGGVASAWILCWRHQLLWSVLKDGMYFPFSQIWFKFEPNNVETNNVTHTKRTGSFVTHIMKLSGESRTGFPANVLGFMVDQGWRWDENSLTWTRVCMMWTSCYL